MRRLPLITAVLFFFSTVPMFADPAAGERLRDRGPAWARGAAMIVEPARPLTDQDRAELAAKGVFVRQALANERLLARVAPGADLSDARLSHVERLTPEMKVHRSAIRELERGASWADLNLVFARDVTFEEARQAVLSAGGTLSEILLTEFLPAQRLEARVPRAALDALTRDERVLAVAGQINFKLETHNAQAGQQAKADVLHQAPYDLTGDGVVVSLFELSGAQGSHVEFGGRLTVNATGGSASDGQHATHVAGTIGAGGVRADAKGLAPKAKISQFRVTGGSSTLNLKNRELPGLGVIADNNSWGYILGWRAGDDGFPVWYDLADYYGAYELSLTAAIDHISNEKGILFIHSAGNDGNGPSLSEWGEHRHVDEKQDIIATQLFCISKNASGNDCPAGCHACEKTTHHGSIPYDTIGMTASAKNIITVGSVTSTSALSTFSSRGPAKDGRIKPEVVARGSQVLSTIPNDQYGRLSGTSMAAPVVTGVAALITEQWRRTFAGANPTPAQLKAVIIHGAEDLGPAGPNGPDYTYGFGLVNAKNSVDVVRADEGRGRRIHNLTVVQDHQSEIPVVVPAAQNLRLVLQWSDPTITFKGNDDIAAKALVNDLDLWVVDPAGNIHRPYVLDKAAPTAAATRGVNTVDNTEMVEIPNAAAGVYRAIVKGTRVAEGPQKAVLVSSATIAPPCIDLQEPNNSAATAHGNLVTGQMVMGGICSQGDLDFFKFEATSGGSVAVKISGGDTPLRATLTGNGANVVVDVPANGTATLNHNVTTVPFPMVLRIEANGSLGADPSYTLVPEFGSTIPARRRSTGR